MEVFFVFYSIIVIIIINIIIIIFFFLNQDGKGSFPMKEEKSLDTNCAQ